MQIFTRLSSQIWPDSVRHKTKALLRRRRRKTYATTTKRVLECSQIDPFQEVVCVFKHSDNEWPISLTGTRHAHSIR